MIRNHVFPQVGGSTLRREELKKLPDIPSKDFDVCRSSRIVVGCLRLKLKGIWMTIIGETLLTSDWSSAWQVKRTLPLSIRVKVDTVP
jgi:hypothetical protein